MKVKELLEQLAPTLETHEVVTKANYSTKLIISIKQRRARFTGEYSNNDLAGNCHLETTIKIPFESSVYVVGQVKAIPILDLDVYRWCFKNEDDKVWEIVVETKEARP